MQNKRDVIGDCEVPRPEAFGARDGKSWIYEMASPLISVIAKIDDRLGKALR